MISQFHDCVCQATVTVWVGQNKINLKKKQNLYILYFKKERSALLGSCVFFDTQKPLMHTPIFSQSHWHCWQQCVHI